jgi:DNA-binding IclR family transcriptional regulator
LIDRTGDSLKTTATPAAARPAEKDGTQVLRRATFILRHVAQSGVAGASLAEIARAHQLARSTAHRILRCLADEGILDQGEDDKRYRVGPLLHELGMAPGASASEISRWRPVVEAVARRTGVTTYLMRRSGVEAVCVVKVDGHGTLRFVPVEVGQRRLLGVGAGATALLAALPDEQREEVIRSISPGLRNFSRIDADSLRMAAGLVLQTGFAMSQGTVVDHGFGLGVIVPAGGATSHLALSIAAHGSVVTESSIERWKKIMREEVTAAFSFQEGA